MTKDTGNSTDRLRKPSPNMTKDTGNSTDRLRKPSPNMTKDTGNSTDRLRKPSPNLLPKDSCGSEGLGGGAGGEGRGGTTVLSLTSHCGLSLVHLVVNFLSDRRSSVPVQWTSHGSSSSCAVHTSTSVLNSCLQLPQLSTDRTDSCLQLPQLSTDRTDSCLQLPQLSTDRTDSCLQLPQLSTDRTDSCLQLSQLSTDRTDSCLQLPQLSTDRTDSCLQLPQLSTDRTDSCLQLPQLSTDSTDKTDRCGPHTLDTSSSDSSTKCLRAQWSSLTLSSNHLPQTLPTRRQYRQAGPAKITPWTKQSNWSSENNTMDQTKQATDD